MMERKFARFFHKMVHELIPDNEQRDRLFDSLRKYQLSQDLQKLLVELRLVLDEPDKLELYEFIRPLVLVRHQMEYSYLAPAVPGVRLRTVRLTRAAGQSLGFAVRGGYEFSVGVFVSSVERGSQAERHGLRVGDEIVRVNGFTIAEAIHDDVLNLIKSKEEIVLKVTHIGMLPVKNHVSDAVTWKYVEDLDSKPALEDVLSSKQAVPGRGSKGLELKLFIDCTGHESMGCGILSGPSHYPGIFVEKVRPGSLGEEVGLEVGDQIVEVNDTSFLSISHKEAVVVLKASKQLNVIVRKHAGLKLFENRSAPVRASVSSGTSSQPHRPPSPSAGQRTSSSKAWEASRSLDEGQLIAEQLGRSGLFKRSSEITGPSQDLTSSSHQFSNNSSHTATRADVHSDSGSAGGEGHRIPVEEPSLPAAVASLSTAITLPQPYLYLDPIYVPDLLPSLASLTDPPDAVLGSGPQVPDDDLPRALVRHNTPPLSDLLELPDDLGDPVLASVRRQILPEDAFPWLKSSTKLGGLTGSGNADPGGTSPDAEKNTFEPLPFLTDENSNVIKRIEDCAVRELGESDVRFLKEESSAVAAESERVKSAADRPLAERHSIPPLFIPPPPPSFPPPPGGRPPTPPPHRLQTSGKLRDKWAPRSRRLSSASTQTPPADGEDSQLLENEEETELIDGEIADGDRFDLQDKVVKASETKGNPAGSMVGETMWKLSDALGCASAGSNEAESSKPAVINQAKYDGWDEDSICEPLVGLEVEAEIHQPLPNAVNGGEFVEDSDSLPPPPSSFFDFDETEPHETASSDPDDPDLKVFPSGINNGKDGQEISNKDVKAVSSPMQIISTLNTGLREDNKSPPLLLPPPPPPPPLPLLTGIMGGAAAVLAARREVQEEERTPRLLGPAAPGDFVGIGLKHAQLAVWFNPLELDGRELQSFVFPKWKKLRVELEGGMGTPLAGRIVVAAVFDEGAAKEEGLQTGDQIVMVNGRKLTDITVAQAEQIIEEAYNSAKEMIQIVYIKSSFFNDEECVTYF